MAGQFRSRVSVVLLLFLMAVVLPVAFFEESPTDTTKAILAYGVLGGALGLVGVLLFTIRYEIDDTHLIIKIGPVSYGKIKVQDIQSIKRSYNPLSSPASSLKRLLIIAKDREALISPQREKEFIRLLKSRNPNINVDVSYKDDWWRFWDWDI